MLGRPLWSVLFAFTLSFAFVDVARAAPKDDAPTARARELFKSGTKHYSLSEYTAALNDFKEAYRLKEDPVFLYNIAQCHRLLGQHEEAARFYRAYLRALPSSPSAPNLSDIEDHVKSEEAAMREAEAATKQKRAVEDEIKLKEAAMREKELQLKLEEQRQKRVYEPWYKDSTGWVLTGVGAVFAIAGGALLGWGASLHQPLPGASPIVVSDYNRNRSLGFGIGGVTAGLGAVALTVGAIKLAIYDKPPKLAATLVPLDGGAFAGFHGSF